MSNKLKIIVCSTRPGRVGLLIGEWFFQRAVANGRFNPDIVDLAKVNLPIFDEPKHPAMQQYEHDHTKKWAAIVNDADAYVFVTPEYNGGPPPALLNALSYVYRNGIISRLPSLAMAAWQVALAQCKSKSKSSQH